MAVNPQARIDSEAGAAPRKTQAERRADAEANLLQAAARLIAERGLSRVSLALIGEEAGYSRGLVNHHFGSKAVLIDRLVALVQTEFSAVAQPANSGESASADSVEPAIERIIALTTAFFGMLRNLSPIHRAFLVLWADAVVSPSEIRSAMAASDRVFRDAIADVITTGIENGIIQANVSPAGFAAALVGELRGVALQMLIDPTGVDLEDVELEMRRALFLTLAI